MTRKCLAIGVSSVESADPATDNFPYLDGAGVAAETIGQCTTAGFEATSLGVLMDEVPILPKLFRRLSDYMAATGTAVGFKQALAQGQDLVWDLRTQQRTHLDTFVDQASGSAHVRLTRDPEELVFDEMPLQPPGFFAALVGAPLPLGA